MQEERAISTRSAGKGTAGSHVENLESAVNSVKSLVRQLERFSQKISGEIPPPQGESQNAKATPCLLDQLINTPDEIHRACEVGFKELDKLNGYLRLGE